MSEYIVRETGYPGQLKQEIVGELVRCKDCKYNSCLPEHGNACCDTFYGMTDQMGFCHYGERRE